MNELFNQLVKAKLSPNHVLSHNVIMHVPWKLTDSRADKLK